MRFAERIKNALRNPASKDGTFCQGNYMVTFDGKRMSAVYMFGHRVFEAYHGSGTYGYDFCGYEGHPKTTHCINICLEAVHAPYRLKTVKGKVVKVEVKA